MHRLDALFELRGLEQCGNQLTVLLLQSFVLSLSFLQWLRNRAFIIVIVFIVFIVIVFIVVIVVIIVFIVVIVVIIDIVIVFIIVVFIIIVIVIVIDFIVIDVFIIDLIGFFIPHTPKPTPIDALDC